MGVHHRHNSASFLLCLWVAERLRGSTKLILHAAEGGVGSVLDLDPVPELAAAVGALAVLGNHALQSQQAGVPEKVRPDLALFEVAQEDAVDAPRQHPGEIGLAQLQRQFADVLAVADQDIEGVELDFVIVLAASAGR